MSVKKFIAICVGSLLLNLILGTVASVLGLPIFLDTCGTIFVAALGSYMPGIAVGFCTNLIRAFVDPVQMYFSTVSILIAIFTTFLARKGYFLTAKKALMIIPAMTIFAGIVSVFIETFLNTASFMQTVRELNMSFFDNFGWELVDKAFSIMTAFVLLQKTPVTIKKSFRLLGQRQAPLSEEMQHAIYNESYLNFSLRTKLLLILLLSAFFISFFLAGISCKIFREVNVAERMKAADAVAAVTLNELNPQRIDDYIKFGRHAPDYMAVESKLLGIKNSSNDINNVFVVRYADGEVIMIFNLNASASGKVPGKIKKFDKDFTVTPLVESDAPGERIDFEESLTFEESRNVYEKELFAGKPVPPLLLNTEKRGSQILLYKPLYDAQGKCQCYVGINFSMNSVDEYTRGFVAHILILFAGCFVFVFVLGLWFIENNIILPVNTMAYCANNFTYDNIMERTKNIALIKGLRIKTGDEIENMYTSLVRSTENIVDYLDRLQLAKIQVENMRVKVFAMDELANTDSLTGVRNKTAYATMIAKLDQHIEDGNAEFCIVMIDVNFLKKVNDTYGHERGNEYLINACKLVCSVFGEDHVYRIGGDEFVVVVSGEKVSICSYFVRQFQTEMAHKKANMLLEPWEKVSAAVGVAVYKKDVDKTADEVFRRADEAMYQNKLAMKAQRTD